MVMKNLAFLIFVSCVSSRVGKKGNIKDDANNKTYDDLASFESNDVK